MNSQGYQFAKFISENKTNTNKTSLQYTAIFYNSISIILGGTTSNVFHDLWSYVGINFFIHNKNKVQQIVLILCKSIKLNTCNNNKNMSKKLCQKYKNKDYKHKWYKVRYLKHTCIVTEILIGKALSEILLIKMDWPSRSRYIFSIKISNIENNRHTHFS